jgi:hypothetical protein
MAYRPIPRRKVKALEKTVSLSTLKEVISPASHIADADATAFGCTLAHDVADQLNELLDALRAASILGRATHKREA